mgnify:CR=1 FL=1
MDVGAPSNFERMQAQYSYRELAALIRGVWVDDKETSATIKNIYEQTGYLLDPHTAVGWRALDKLEEDNQHLCQAKIIASTAHPAKFSEIVEPLSLSVPMPPALLQAMEREVRATNIEANAEELINTLKQHIEI